MAGPTFSVVVPVTPDATAEIVTAPCFRVFAFPFASMVATVVSDDDHETVVSACELPSLNVPAADKFWVKPAATVEFCGVTAIVVSVAGFAAPPPPLPVLPPPPQQLLNKIRKHAVRRLFTADD